MGAIAVLLWQPPGIVHAGVPASTMIAAVEKAQANTPQAYVEALHVNGPDGAFDATAHVLGKDYRIDVTLDGVSYAYGRVEGLSWRQTPNGVVRVVASDVQSDALDRWPRSRFGFSSDGCASDGTTNLGGKTLWVLQCTAAGDIPHWYDIDPSSGEIRSEVARDGAHVFTYDFSGARHWTIHGYGGDAQVAVASLSAQPVTAGDVAIPAATHSIFKLPASGIADIPVEFGYHIDATVEIDGARRSFTVDTGTSQILIDIGESARLGLHPKFGHVIIPTLRVGDAVAHDVAAQAVNLFHDRDGAGILGNEFFIGHIVHIDYTHRKVQLIAHDVFQPPPDARPIGIDVREGMPLVQAGANGVIGERFALDTGSYWIMLSSNFADATGADKDPIVRFRPQTIGFLEGPVAVQLREMPSFEMVPYRFPNVEADVEIRAAGNLDIPLDGVIGQNVLSAFEWWYDYDDGIAWLRAE